MKPNDTVNLCDMCNRTVSPDRMQLLGFSGGNDSVIGYCHMCGTTAVFAGKMKRNDPRLEGHELFYEKEVEK